MKPHFVYSAVPVFYRKDRQVLYAKFAKFFILIFNLIFVTYATSFCMLCGSCFSPQRSPSSLREVRQVFI